MKRHTTAVLIATAVTGLVGCGGHTHRAAPPRPKLPRTLAERLAQESDLIAARLGAGDACGALAAAKGLQQQTIDAINHHQVPGALQEPLGNAVADLAVRI